jgi:phosphoribosyl-ATP pyrophosphohydrolase/phosphoribosyl-AMP cyclohydrolase
MIIPSVDIQSGNAVQLVGGKSLAIDAGDPLPIAERFGLVGEIAVIDLDAALGVGSNSVQIEQMLSVADCRVGGGIRTLESAIRWLDNGAQKIIIGTAAQPELLRKLPKHRIIAALDGVDGEVHDEGWQRATGRSVTDRMEELLPYVGGFLVTMIEREGRLVGSDLEFARSLRKTAGVAKLTIAGGVATVEEIRELDEMGIDAQVGMALYSGKFDLASALTAILKSDRPDGLWPTVVTNEQGVALGLCYSNEESLRIALSEKAGVYFSRSRGLWRKGSTSGNRQKLINVDLDCDRDTLRFTVRQEGDVFCHNGSATCWGDHTGLSALATRIDSRSRTAVSASYTQRLLNDRAMLHSKLVEEAVELAEAVDKEHARHEAADLLYFLFVTLADRGLSLAEVERELDKRSLKIIRRPGAVKAASIEEIVKEVIKC